MSLYFVDGVWQVRNRWNEVIFEARTKAQAERFIEFHTSNQLGR